MLSIEATPTPGDRIEDTAREAAQVSQKLGVTVIFNFNTVRMLARPVDSPEDIIQRYYRDFDARKARLDKGK